MHDFPSVRILVCSIVVVADRRTVLPHLPTDKRGLLRPRRPPISSWLRCCCAFAAAMPSVLHAKESHRLLCANALPDGFAGVGRPGGGHRAFCSRHTTIPSAGQTKSGYQRIHRVGGDTASFSPEGSADFLDPLMASIGYTLIDFVASLLLHIVLFPSARAVGYDSGPRLHRPDCLWSHLLHEPAALSVQKLLSRMFGIVVVSRTAASIPIYAAAAFVAASLSWRYFESPILTLKTRFTVKMTASNMVRENDQASVHFRSTI